MNFIPETPKDQISDVPYFDDVSGDAGWQGQSTGKSIDALKAEVIAAISRLGGAVSTFQKGTYKVGNHDREGYQIVYAIESPGGKMTLGRIDVAALPVKTNYRKSKSLATRKEKSLKMALYVLAIALNGTWYLQQLSPGYSALIPWMLEGNKQSGKTIAQLWAGQMNTNLLLPEKAEFSEDV